jgi:hypothetical protein
LNVSVSDVPPAPAISVLSARTPAALIRARKVPHALEQAFRRKASLDRFGMTDGADIMEGTTRQERRSGRG